MTKKDKELHNIEFMEHMLRDWAESMWKENNKGKYPDERKRDQAFIDLWYPDNNRGLTKGQSLSEHGFVLYVHAAVYSVGLVSRKAVDALADNKLVNAWRKSVQKNSFQQKYSLLEGIIADTVASRGTAAAVAQFPKMNVSSPDEIAAALEYMNFKAAQYPVSTVAGLIRASNRGPAAAAQSPGGPKAA